MNIIQNEQEQKRKNTNIEKKQFIRKRIKNLHFSAIAMGALNFQKKHLLIQKQFIERNFQLN